ncbi:ATP-binding protein [Streptomyces solincola]|uniref:ATP-binding protein n=1 Tax=Streptomyces solincola TaxID=2100817 RepID=A0A2S9PU17_9ACTN|nr:ATP-binding protein [Streptomyces solincola]PRH77827.1 ATP-binding protein [Streptomyces solincola]
MIHEPELPQLREAFYRRDRRSVSAARRFTSEALDAWGVKARSEDIVLCVSELATNALLHGVPPGRGFRLCLARPDGGTTVRVEVHDSGDGVVRQRDPGRGEESGRGLLLVAALADRWGVGERSPGKAVWCEFREEDAS